MLSSGANVIMWDEMLSSGMKCYHLELMLSSGTKCYHLGWNAIIWDATLSSGANVIIWDKMLSCGANVVMLSYWANVIICCYLVMLSSGMITPPFFIFPENFTHSPATEPKFVCCSLMWTLCSTTGAKGRAGNCHQPLLGGSSCPSFHFCGWAEVLSPNIGKLRFQLRPIVGIYKSLPDTWM
jgi:hypothetical protein